MTLSSQGVLAWLLPLSVVAPSLLGVAGMALDSEALRLASAWAFVPLLVILVGAAGTWWWTRFSARPSTERRRESALRALAQLASGGTLLEVVREDGTRFSVVLKEGAYVLREGEREQSASEPEVIAAVASGARLEMRRAGAL